MLAKVKEKTLTKLTNGILSLASLVAVMLAFTQPAFAYIDPGTGSMLLQLLMGGVAGALVVVKMYWKGFAARFGFGSRSGERVEDDQLK
jgi:type IV secretory pathway VirB2 component (pilin)